MTKILVCDDDARRIKVWNDRIAAKVTNADISCYSGERLASLVDALYRREQQARGAADDLPPEAVDCLNALNEADIVVLDSDLSPTFQDLSLVEEGRRAQVSQILRNGYGDAIARQVRSYTSAGLIIVANMFWGRHQRPRVFDLTMVQEEHSHADINIEDAELGDVSLWKRTEARRETYNPWKRPSVDEALSVVRSSLVAVSDLDASALSTLGLPSKSLLTRQTDLFSDHEDLEAVTFRQLAYSRLGFRYKGDADDALPHSEDSERRMAASVVRRWLRRTVLPPQNLIADAPHLALRMWPLMGASPSPADWEKLTTLRWGGEIPWSAPVNMLDDLQPFIDVPVFSVNASADVLNQWVPDSPAIAVPDLVFAEDSSSFLTSDEVEVFASDLPGPFARRAVEYIPDVGYEPAPRLLF